MTAKLVAASIGFMNNKAHGLTLFDVVLYHVYCIFYFLYLCMIRVSISKLLSVG